STASPHVILSTHSSFLSFFLLLPLHPSSTLFPYTTLFRSDVFSFSSCPAPKAFITEIPIPSFSQRRYNAIRSSTLPMPYSPFRRSEEHTSELQSRFDLVCRLLLETKKT